MVCTYSRPTNKHLKYLLDRWNVFYRNRNPIWPIEGGRVDPRAASSKCAISRTVEGRGAATRESIERIHVNYKGF